MEEFYYMVCEKYSAHSRQRRSRRLGSAMRGEDRSFEREHQIQSFGDLIVRPNQRTIETVFYSMIELLRTTYRRLKSIPLFVFGTITHVSTSKPAVALTFDDGPDPVFTPRLLDILQQHHAKATFFMVGQAAERHPDIVKKVAAAGHAIGNLSWDHPSFPLLTGRERRDQ